MQSAAVRMPSLQNVFPDAQREKQIALLMDDGNALRAFAEGKAAGRLSIELDAAGERSELPGEHFQQCGFSASVRAENADNFSLARREVDRPESKHRRRNFGSRIGVAGLLDGDPHRVFHPACESA